jgi:esterase/lipase superfamily enzyme
VKATERWRSERLGQDVVMARWGAVGKPILIFPTAGGDAEEIERFLVIDVLSDLLAAGRIKVYSVDSVAGRAMLRGDGDGRYRGWLQNQYQEFVYREVVPAIRHDCRDPVVEIVVAGSSIGAFNALALLCRFPDAFSHALCMSGTFDLVRFYKGDPPGPEFWQSSPIHFLPHVQGEHLDRIRSRFVLFASGEGRWEDIGESWRAAHLLGSAGVPNRVDSWGADRDHDWPLWREMLPKYLAEWS